MFYHSYESYLRYASDYDELKPISCQGTDTWGQFSLSLIDALDTLAVLGNYSEFRRVAQLVARTADFNTNINVSVFETNIRVVGGLLSAHLLSQKAGMETELGWPCQGPLLRLAEDAARRLLPAFDTNTGMPYGTVNLRYGVPENETPITCTAGVGTFILEFGALSRLTGDPIFETKALKAINALHETRSQIGLVGNHINVQDGKWTATESGIGGGVDSYFEYLVKGAMLLQMPHLMRIFYDNYEVINKYIRKEDWYVWVQMSSGTPTMPIFQSLEAFWPGVLTLIGEIDQAKKSLYNYHQVWKQYGFTPEFYDIPNSKSNSKRDGYPLRPEFIESVLYLYRATKDPHLLQIGADVIDSIAITARTECGFATIKSVGDHTIEDRMESFFLAETLKYLYLLFDETNFVHNDGSSGRLIDVNGSQCVVDTGSYVFNTEAHLIDIAAVDCCSAHKRKQIEELNNLRDNLDLFSLFDIKDSNNLWPKRNKIREDVPIDANSDSESLFKPKCDEYLETKTIINSMSETDFFPEKSSSENELDFDRIRSQTSKLITENIDLFSPTVESSLNPSHIPSVEKTISQNFNIKYSSDVSSVESVDQTTDSSAEPIETGLSSVSSEMQTVFVSTQSFNGWHSKSESESLEETKISVVSDNSLISDEVIENVLTNASDSSKESSVPSDNSTMFEVIDNFYEDYELLLCPSQPLLSRLSNFGQMLIYR